jgi:tRNA A-37 threonylcarbamoyl transferase component Bud32
MTQACPEEDVLSSIASGDSLPPEVLEHASACPECRQKIHSLEAGLNTLQNLWASRKTIITSPVACRPMEVGKYLIVGTLGEGAQAVVYRGLHPALGRDVVLKLAKQSPPPSDDLRAGLVQEGKLLSMLDHPGIARVLDLDFHEGKPYLVIEHVEGVDLEKYAAGGASPRQAADIVAQVAQAVASAHDQGVVHYDIKPRNILIRDEDTSPVLIDFGLALLRKAGGSDYTPGGTLAYMAPEQARGEADQVGPCSDVFALGAVLYHLLTGQPPFQGSSPGEVMRKAMACDWDRKLLDASPAPARLKGLCQWALSPRPKDRPHTARAFAEALEKEPASNTRRLLWAGVIALPLALVALAALYWPRPLPPAPRAQVLARLVEPLDGDKERVSFLTGDKVQLRLRIPPGSQAALYWLGSEGAVEELPLHEAEPGLLRYPATGVAPVNGPPGTDVLLAVCSRNGRPLPTAAEVKRWLREVNDGHVPWPALPARGFRLLMSPEGVDVSELPRGLGKPEETQLSRVQRCLEKLREVLKPHCDWAWAEAIPHG